MKAEPVNTQAWDDLRDFQTFGDPQLERMKKEAASFIDDIRNNRTPRWLSLLGTSGAGKTMLAKLIHRFYQREKHLEIDWPATERTRETAPRVIRWRGGFLNWGNAVNNRMLKGDYDFLEDVAEFSFFALDDIAAEYEKHRALSASKLYGVLESRLKKWTVLTANLSLEQIGEALDARIASRMIRHGSVVVDVNVTDYNLRKEAA
jgi:DNA replication protein DnaC